VQCLCYITDKWLLTSTFFWHTVYYFGSNGCLCIIGTPFVPFINTHIWLQHLFSMTIWGFFYSGLTLKLPKMWLFYCIIVLLFFTKCIFFIVKTIFVFACFLFDKADVSRVGSIKHEIEMKWGFILHIMVKYLY